MAKKKSKTGMMLGLDVYQGQVLVGYGFIVFHNGKAGPPTLFDLLGNALPSEKWYNLIPTGESQLVVVNETKQ